MRRARCGASSTGSSPRSASSLAQTPAGRAGRVPRRGPFPDDVQHELSLVVARAFGADERSFRLDPTVHPFCIAFATQDVRLTTRYAEHDLHGSRSSRRCTRSATASTSTASTRARAEPARHRLLVRAARVPEPALGERRRPLAAVLALVLPAVPGRLPNALGDVPLEQFHRAINRSRPSLIRVDADETTYGLHIILRFELEQELSSGGLATDDLPEAWNAQLEELSGSGRPTTGSAASRTCTGLRACSATSRRTSSGT